MINKIKSIINRFLEPQAMVLMYHRTADLESDIWKMNVSPYNFEKHLQVLKSSGNVISLTQLAESVKKKSIKRNSIAITFDDGYIDNYLIAKPLLEKYQLPATFFITSGNIGSGQEFWWDELESIILYSERFPNEITYDFNNELIHFKLHGEEVLSEELLQAHKTWNAVNEPAPTTRGRMFLKLWEKMKPLPHEQQQTHLQVFRSWVQKHGHRKDYMSMSESQLAEIGKSKYIDIGLHTVFHAALAFHKREHQKLEIDANQKYLEAVLGKKVEILAYPFGNYNETTKEIASELNLKACFTTEEQNINKYSKSYQLGRYVVENLSGEDFSAFINRYK